MEKNTRLFRKKDKPELPPVHIINENEKFIGLSNGDTVLKTVFHTMYEDNTDVEIDPKSFLNSTNFGSSDTLFKDKAPDVKKNIDQVNDIVQAEREVTRIDNTQSEVDQQFEDEVQVYGVAEATKRKRERMKRGIYPTQRPIQQPTTQVNTNSAEQIQTVQQYTQQQVDPSEMMFKTFKRNHDITITLDFKDKIGSPEFVRMMMENIEGDIIVYYKRLIMDNIMKQVNRIEREVEKQLRMEIFGISDDEPMTDVEVKPIETKNENTETIIIEKLNEDNQNNTETKKDEIVDEKKTYINDKGKKVKLLPKTAEKKGFKLFKDDKNR